MKKKIEAILHPVRMRILQTFLNGDQLTAQQIRETLTDVAVPTLYRHLNTLVNYEIIEIVKEIQVRGTVEKTYALPSTHLFSKEDIKKATPEEHMDYFTIFMTNLLSQFNNYVTDKCSNASKDKVSYRQIQLLLSDQEFEDMFKILSNAMLNHLDNKPTTDRKLYSISTVVIPLLNKEE